MTDPFDALFRQGRASRFSPADTPFWTPQEYPTGLDMIQPAGFIEPGAIDFAQFASGIRPPKIVSALPALPDATNWPVGSTVFLTTDGHMYQTADGTTWVAQGDTSLIVGTITAGQIAAGAVGADQIAANAVVAGKIGAGAVVIGNLARKGANLLDDPSFETAPAVGFDTVFANGSDASPYWTSGTTGCVSFTTSSFAKTGSHVLKIQGDGAHTFPVLNSDFIPVTPGRTYRLSAWIQRFSGALNARIAIASYSKTKAVVGNPARSIDVAPASMTYIEAAPWTCPTDGSVSYVRFQLMIATATPAANTEIFLFEDAEFVEIPNNLQNGTAEVTIDSTGITIANGKLTFLDSSGQTALDQYGFGANWLDFLARLFYNGSFLSGSTSDIPVSETGSGSGTANYQASLSPNLPYWVVAASGGTVKRVTDTGAVGSSALEFSAAGTSRIYQDIPVRPGHAYRIQWNWKVTADVSHSVTLNVYFSWRTSDHVLIGSRVAQGLLYQTNFGYTVQMWDTAPGVGAAPSNAAYMRVEFEVVTPSTIGTARFSDVTLLDGGKSPEVTVYSTPGSYVWSKPAGLKYVVYEVWGAGGAGGGAATTGAGQGASGGSGGGGSYARLLVEAQDVGSSVTIDVGAGGTPGAAGANAGGAGGFSDVLDTAYSINAAGGNGGSGGAATAAGSTAGGTGGDATGGDINVRGGAGSNGTVISGSPVTAGTPGGTYGVAPNREASSFSTGGTNAGPLYGTGGGRGMNGASQATARQGGSGGDGRVIVTAYFE